MTSVKFDNIAFPADRASTKLYPIIFKLLAHMGDEGFKEGEMAHPYYINKGTSSNSSALLLIVLIAAGAVGYYEVCALTGVREPVTAALRFVRSIRDNNKRERRGLWRYVFINTN